LGTRILVRLLGNCLIWLAQPGEELTPVWGAVTTDHLAVTVPCRRRAILVRQITFGEWLFEILCSGRLVTIPVRLPGRIKVRVGGPMREVS